MSALRFFLGITLDRPDLARRLVMAREAQKLPSVLTATDAAPGPKAKAAMAVAYGAGLRVSEVVALEVTDIDSARMLLGSSRARARRTAMPCSRRSSWRSCAAPAPSS